MRSCLRTAAAPRRQPPTNPAARVLADALFGERAHARMDDRFELFARVGIVEDDRAQSLPVEGLVGLQHFAAKCRDDLIPAVVAGSDDLTGEHVGVDDRRAKTPQDFRHRAFARRDTASQSNEFHATVIAKSLEAFKQKV